MTLIVNTTLSTAVVNNNQSWFEREISEPKFLV